MLNTEMKLYNTPKIRVKVFNKIIKAIEQIKNPWKNGLGETSEVAIYPENATVNQGTPVLKKMIIFGDYV
jgi:hypothetical protein